MSRTTIATTVIAVATLAVAAPATNAATRPAPRKPVCKLVTDAPDDAPFPVAQASSQNVVDIVSADLASDAKRLTAVVRVTGTGSADQALSYRIAARFTPPGSAVPLYLAYQHDAVAGNVVEWGTYNAATSSYDPKGNTPDIVTGSYAGNEFHVTVLLSALAGFKVAPGARLTGLAAESRAWTVPYYGQRNPLIEKSADTAENPKASYVAGWPSCVKVGS